ncbi:integrin alpha-X-like [Protopterus annectens]|uniref:integrin alpha-X-like n=1 Tax=Protopterus annectens TaxID=7888 RepID=UPI001CF94E36|nr:integrin alpha-X-like [Protopterus annectens]
MSPVWFASLFWSLLHLSWSYNLDTDILAFSFEGNISEQFGHKVLYFQTNDNKKWIVVSAPYKQSKQGNRTGGIYRCLLNSSRCEAVQIPDADDSGVTSIGLTLTTTAPVHSSRKRRDADKDHPKLLVCSSSMTIQCDKMMYMSGICYEFEDVLKIPKSISSEHGKCSKKELDLVLLFDGSESLKPEDFEKTKEFMINIMEKFRNTDVQFSAVQFSKYSKVVFNFTTYRTATDLAKLVASAEHMKDITNVFQAMQDVMENVYTTESGARENAVRAMIIITDGESTDYVDKRDVVREAESQGIIRFAIGIGVQFGTGQKGLADLKLMASSDKHMFTLTAYKDLENVLNDLQSKIFVIEGEGNGDNRTEEHFKMELSQTGFSAAINSERRVLGAVGADDWAGALVVSGRNHSETIVRINSSQDDPKYSYLGYALKELRIHSQVMYAAGAPRYQHTGKVVLFDIHVDEFLPVQHILGEQIGSYFGAELETVDLDGDRNTDLLLIGAPLYHTPTIGGLVYICTTEATGNFSCNYTLNGKPKNLLIRFGAAIASIGDINGDGITDIAIGAPLEDEHRGGIYLFHGTQSGIMKEYTQHIKGSEMVPGFKYFGQSIYGKEDLNNDGLNDTIVGSLGKVVVIRSKPVVNISCKMHFASGKLKPEKIYCTDRFHASQEDNLTVCFHMKKIHTGIYENLSANLTYLLQLDTENRGTGRLVFENSMKKLESTIIVSVGEICKNHTLIIPRCSDDFTSPIEIVMNFLQNKNGNAEIQPVIWKTFMQEQVQNAKFQILFEKNCGEDDECISDLGITFDFSGVKNLVLQKPNVQFRLNITLSNNQEDATHTVMSISYPSGVSYRKITTLQKITLNCNSTTFILPSVKMLTCNISHPVLRQKTVVMFEALFDVSDIYFENNTLKISVAVQSDNEKNSTLADNSKEVSIPVRNSISVAVKGLDNSTYYMDFTKEKDEAKEVFHSYEVHNHGDHDLPVDLTFHVISAFSSGFTWTAALSTTNSAACIQNTTNKDSTEAQENSTTTITSYHCNISKLEKGAHTEITFSGMASVNKMKSLENFEFYSTAKLHYNKEKYFQKDENFHEAKITTHVNIIVLENHMPLIIGSAVGGFILLIIIIAVLYKVGFFKRNLKHKMDECNKETCEMDENEEQNAEEEKCQNGEVKEEKANAEN